MLIQCVVQKSSNSDVFTVTLGVRKEQRIEEAEFSDVRLFEARVLEEVEGIAADRLTRSRNPLLDLRQMLSQPENVRTDTLKLAALSTAIYK